MEAILSLLLAMAPAPSPVTCGTTAIYTTIRGDYVTLRCSRGFCSGRVPSQSLSVREICGSSSLTFDAFGAMVAQTIQGYCRNGRFDSSTPMTYVELRGSCSDGTRFKGKVQRRRNWVDGRCEQDGTTMIRVPTQTARVGGVCY